jgi:cytochrome c5
MSEYQQTRNTSHLNPNLVAFILISTFTIAGILILSNLKTPSLQSQDGGSAEVALAEFTATVVPYHTPASPTSTSTPLPTATEVLLTPTVNNTPQTASDTGHGSTGNTTASYDPALVTQGEQLFLVCSACHGADARGLPNLGKDLVESEFIHSLNDQDLLTFIKTGRPSWDALNTSGIDMPPKGGNPAFSDEDILAIIAYLRSLS